MEQNFSQNLPDPCMTELPRPREFQDQNLELDLTTAVDWSNQDVTIQYLENKMDKFSL